jgi:hypothetical protein
MILKETLLISASVAFFIIWILEIYNGVPLKASYFWVMLGLGFLLYFQYSKNIRLKKEEKTSKKDASTIKPKKLKK